MFEVCYYWDGWEVMAHCDSLRKAQTICKALAQYDSELDYGIFSETGTLLSLYSDDVEAVAGTDRFLEVTASI